MNSPIEFVSEYGASRLAGTSVPHMAVADHLLLVLGHAICLTAVFLLSTRCSVATIFASVGWLARLVN